MTDYERIERALRFVSDYQDAQPSLAEIAAHVHLSPHHFQRLFSRWAGISPKRFLQALTVDRAKRLLASPKPLLEIAEEVGLSSGSRLYDHFVQLDAMTPGEARQGAGLVIRYASCDTPFGPTFIARTPRGLCRLAFHDDPAAELHDLRRHWPEAELRPDAGQIAPLAEQNIGDLTDANRPLSLCVRGTNFQVQVWRALLRIPRGRFASYGQIAQAVGKPRAARAVGAAVGANPIAFLIPCHRVIRQTGDLGGYRWGTPRKQAILAWEDTRS